MYSRSRSDTSSAFTLQLHVRCPFDAAPHYTGRVQPLPARHANELHECRRCCSFCDRVVHPSGCIASGCQFLYLYDDDETGRRFMGCMHNVFRGEIDL